MPQFAATLAVNAAIAGGSYLLSRVLTPKPKVQQTPQAGAAKPSEALTERTIPVQQALPPRRFVYGAGRISGPLFYYDNSNPYLYTGVVICDGPIGSITGLYIGGTQISLAAESPSGQAAAANGTQYYERLNYSYRLGTDSQAIDPLLSGLAGLTSDFRQRGVATFVTRAHWGLSSIENSSLWGNSIEPSVTGTFRTVYDPRNGSHALATESTWTYSDNPALCVAHALTNAWGVALATTAIDWTSVAAAANACDVTTTYNAVSVKLFTISGVFESGGDLASQIQSMLDSFRGHITYSDGLYKIVADTARTSVWTITDDDILEVGEYIAAADSGAMYNTIKGLYTDVSDASRSTEAPVYEDSAAVTADGRRETALNVPWCAAKHSAQILAYRKLYELRNGRRAALRVTDAALFLDAFELVTIACTAFPFLNGTWQIDMSELADEGVVLNLREYVSQLYTNPTTYLI